MLVGHQGQVADEKDYGRAKIEGRQRPIILIDGLVSYQDMNMHDGIASLQLCMVVLTL